MCIMNNNKKISMFATSRWIKNVDILTKFRLEILTRTTISAIYKFQENIFESLQNVSETTPDYAQIIKGPFH